MRSGPLPAPEIIEGYEKVLPGAADRIIKMAEKEQSFFHDLATQDHKRSVILTFTGQLFAFLIGMSGIGAGVYLIQQSKSPQGLGVFFTSLATLVGVYFYNQRKAHKPDKPQ